MMEMGNSRARAVYEANVPDGFRRPQTDSYPLILLGWLLLMQCMFLPSPISMALCPVLFHWHHLFHWLHTLFDVPQTASFFIINRNP